MIRAGVVPEDVVKAAISECEAKGEPDAAREVEALWIEALSEPATDYVARTRRPELRVVPDGGKSTA